MINLRAGNISPDNFFMFIENELKIKLEKKEFEFLKSFTDKQPVVQVNHYFDTLPVLSVMIRIREKNGLFALQFKKRNSFSDGVINSVEKGIQVDEAFFRDAVKNGLDKNFVNNCLGCKFDKDLKYLGYAVTERIKFDLFGFQVELDKTTAEGQSDFELEFEGDDEDILKLKKRLEENGIKIVASQPKFQRFLTIRGLI